VSAAIYDFCGLDPAASLGVSLLVKERILRPDGRVGGIRKVARFYRFEEMGRHMRADANAASLRRMPPEALAEITRACRPVLEHFGYLDGAGAAEPPQAAAATGGRS
jgi:hypothetical protein